MAALYSMLISAVQKGEEIKQNDYLIRQQLPSFPMLTIAQSWQTASQFIYCDNDIWSTMKEFIHTTLQYMKKCQHYYSFSEKLPHSSVNLHIPC